MFALPIYGKRIGGIVLAICSAILTALLKIPGQDKQTMN